jgi:hypothetical protein
VTNKYQIFARVLSSILDTAENKRDVIRIDFDAASLITAHFALRSMMQYHVAWTSFPVLTQNKRKAYKSRGIFITCLRKFISIVIFVSLFFAQPIVPLA